MECPVCKKEEMIALELVSIEIDHCLTCGGIWFDEGELGLLFNESETKDAIFQSFQTCSDSHEVPRRCPICRRHMKKVWCGKEKKVLIDQCPHNHGLWFDQGELEHLACDQYGGEVNRITTLLDDMFAYAKKNKIKKEETI